MIQDIEHFRAKLDVESLRDTLDLIVLEYRKVQVCDARTNQNISARVTAEIEAKRRRDLDGRARTRLNRRWELIAVRCEKI